MKTTLLIGIDPDCDKSGYALYRPDQKQFLLLDCLDLVDLMEQIEELNQVYKVKVYLEAGWLEKKANWSDRNIYGSRAANEKIAKNVGANHELGRQIEKFCQKKAIEYNLVKPSGYSAWKHETFCAVTGWPIKSRTNSETRVAGMMVFGHK